MSTLPTYDEDFLEIIPQESLQAHNLGPYRGRRRRPIVYRMLRPLQHVRDLYRSQNGRPIGIQRENGVLMYFWDDYFELDLHPDEYLLKLEWRFDKTYVNCTIVGTSKEDVVETNLMLWNLPASDLKSCYLYSGDALPATDLFRWFQENYSTSPIIFQFVSSRKEEYLRIERNSEGYALYYSGAILEPYLKAIARMPNVQEANFTIKPWALSPKLTLLALAIPARKLSLVINENAFKKTDVSSVNILAKDVFINIHVRGGVFPGNLVASLLRQMGQTGQLEKVSFAYTPKPHLPESIGIPVPENVAKELVRVIKANDDLKLVKFCHGSFLTEWGNHAKEVIAAIKQNRGLIRAILDTANMMQERWKAHKTSIFFCEEPVQLYGPFYQCFGYFARFVRLTQEPPAVRQPLVMQALSGNRLNTFQLCSAFLEQHTDTLCEILQESLGGSSEPIPDRSEDGGELSATVSSDAVSSGMKRPISEQQGSATKKQG